MSTSDAEVQAALEDILDIMEEGKYFIRVGRIMAALKTILSYFAEQLEGTFASSGPGVSPEQTLATLESLQDKMRYATETKPLPDGSFAYSQIEAAIDPATIMVIINVAIQLIKLWKKLRG